MVEIYACEKYTSYFCNLSKFSLLSTKPYINSTIILRIKGHIGRVEYLSTLDFRFGDV